MLVGCNSLFNYYGLVAIWLGVNSLGESCTDNLNHFHIGLYIKYCGHSMGVIPGLVSIPVVKSFCVLFVYYGFLWEFHFAASFLYYNYYYFFVILFLIIYVDIFLVIL